MIWFFFYKIYSSLWSVFSVAAFTFGEIVLTALAAYTKNSLIETFWLNGTYCNSLVLNPLSSKLSKDLDVLLRVHTKHDN